MNEDLSREDEADATAAEINYHGCDCTCTRCGPLREVRARKRANHWFYVSGDGNEAKKLGQLVTPEDTTFYAELLVAEEARRR